MTKRTAVAATVLSPVAVLALAVLVMPGRQVDPAEFVTISTAIVDYREPGQFLQDGAPVNGPLREIMPQRPFEIMKRQVTRGEYDRCVASGACHGIADAGDPDLPLVGVSYDDAVDYATWLTAETGTATAFRRTGNGHWRRARATSMTPIPRSATRRTPRSAGSPPMRPRARGRSGSTPGRNCGPFRRERERASGRRGQHLGVDLDLFRAPRDRSWDRHDDQPRELRRPHRPRGPSTYMTSFFRDPKTGACSVDVPPTNLGIRLVREEPGLVARLHGFLDRLGGRLPG